MRKGIVTLFLVAIAAAFLTVAAFADTVAVGTGEVTGSWTQRFQTNTTSGPFDRIEFFMVLPSAFETPGADSFGSFTPSTSNDWSAALINPTYLVLTGTALTYLQFNLHFAPAQSVPFTLYGFQYSNGVLLNQETTIARWSGSSWSYVGDPNNNGSGFDRTAVPEPGLLLLLGLGVGTCALANLRTRKNHS